jgi:hypothetical protein
MLDARPTAVEDSDRAGNPFRTSDLAFFEVESIGKKVRLSAGAG